MANSLENARALKDTMNWRRMKKTHNEKNNFHIKDWPEGDRPSEMLLEKGPEALSMSNVNNI